MESGFSTARDVVKRNGSISISGVSAHRMIRISALPALKEEFMQHRQHESGLNMARTTGKEANMENKKLKPFIVDITEEYRKSVVVWAEDQAQANSIADDLCGENVIEFTVDDFTERTVQDGYKVRSLEDCRYYTEYDEDGYVHSGRREKLYAQTG